LLYDRYQRVLLNNTKFRNFITSKWYKLDHSVPQDSVLGSLLCVLDINDLRKIINNTSVAVVFTDNSILFTHNKTDSLNTNVHYTLKVINKFFTKHLTEHNIVSKERYGFKTNLRTDNAMYF